MSLQEMHFVEQHLLLLPPCDIRVLLPWLSEPVLLISDRTHGRECSFVVVCASENCTLAGTNSHLLQSLFHHALQLLH
jgi:hypothetical protein